MRKFLFLLFFSGLYFVGFSQIVVVDTILKSPKCSNGYDGSISLTVIGGAPPYHFYWSGPYSLPDTNVIEYIPAGTYTVVIVDQNFNSQTEVYNLQDPLAPTINSTITNPTCFGSNDGSVSITVTGALEPFIIDWSEYSPGIQIDMLNYVDVSPGYYYGYLVDSNDCWYNFNFELNEPTEISVLLEVTPKDCYGNNGEIIASATNGIEPYAYNWSNGANTNIINSLNIGYYTVTVVDANGCSKTASELVYASGNLSVSITQDSIIRCNGEATATLTAFASGVSPYTYTWESGQTTSTIDNLTAGTYVVTVTDSDPNSGTCPNVALFVVTEPDPLMNEIEKYNISCHGNSNGYINLYTSGGMSINGYFYSWSTTQGSFNYASQLAAGTYSVTVSDDFNCSVVETIEIIEPDPLEIDTVIINNGCYGMNNGSIVIHLIGGTGPYEISADSLNWGNVNFFDNLAEGTYKFYFKDYNYCSIPSATFQIVEPTTAVSAIISSTPADCGDPATGTATVSPNGGTPPYSFVWSLTNNDTTATVSNLIPDVYAVSVWDANGCHVSESVTVSQLGLSQVSGSIFANSTLVPDGSVEVELYKESTDVFQLELNTSIYNGVNGMYSFSNVEPGFYTLRALPNSTSIPNSLNTWFPDTISWEGATVFEIGCEDTLTGKDIIIETTPVLTGSGSFSGSIHFYEFEKGALAVGEPVIGAEIFIEQEPNDTPISSAFSGNDGSYSVSGLDENKSYSIHVEIPGLPMISTYSNIPVTPAHSDYTNLNYYVDTTSTYGGIFVDSSLSVTIEGLQTLIINTYPNPVQDKLYVEFNADNTFNYSISLYDVKGVLVDEKINLQALKGNNKTQFEIEKSGIYFVTFNIENNVFVKKIIKE